MSRTISLALREAINAQETGEIPVVLVSIQHPDFAGVLRLSSDPTEALAEARYGTTHDGDEYLFCPMSIQLPDDMDERAPTARLAIENVSRELVEFLRSVTTPGTCRIALVLASDPDTIEIEWPEFDLKNVSFNANMISIEVGLDALDSEPFPAGIYGPTGFPSLF